MENIKAINCCQLIKETIREELLHKEQKMHIIEFCISIKRQNFQLIFLIIILLQFKKSLISHINGKKRMN